MSTDPFRFLSGRSGAAWWNANPPAASNPNPPAAGNSNPNPPWVAASNPNPPNIPRPRSEVPTWPMPSPAPPPRAGLDPDWVYAGEDAMLGQALRRSRARIVGQRGAPLTADQLARAAAVGQPLQGSNLWRWGPEFRIKAVAAELVSRTPVVDGAVWLTEPPPATRCRMLFQPLTPKPKGEFDDSTIDWDTQIDKVVRAATESEDRLPEILSQADGFWPFYESITGLALDRTPALGELLGATHDWTLHVLMLLKHQLAVRRPVQRSSLAMPVIATPGHGSLPSGHATTASFTSELLCILLYEDAGTNPHAAQRARQLRHLARRIAFNRVVAGVHFPVDSQVGHRLGVQLARTAAALAGHEVQDLPVRPPKGLFPKDVVRKPFELVETDDAAPRVVTGARTEVAQALATLWAESLTQLTRVRV